MAVKRLKIACAGLGRMGKRHALNYLDRTPRAQLVAVFTPDPVETEWARKELEPVCVTIYSDYDEMLQFPGLEAVVIVTVTAVHAEQSIKAINADRHVFSEKPLSTSVEVSQAVVDAAAAKPHLKVLCGFSRRFDKSSRDAFRHVDPIGPPSVFRSQTCDVLDPSGFSVPYAECLAAASLWTTPSTTLISRCAVEPGLRKHKDVDNDVGIVEFWNDKFACFFCSRMMAAGQHDITEILGPKGKLVVNGNPMSTLVEVHEPGGVRRELPANYYERFGYAFLTMANEFTAACLSGTPLPLKLAGAAKALSGGCKYGTEDILRQHGASDRIDQ
ncbi:hypothetical protein F503_06324 [Ophiostoma piceae UAMH 11346]|uniref:Gfo/Idh/MocA-like oxidoreductase N-terminal domain-containing protein n=1 Tax=Ophiostoma piceae (strain UAMH 11346) TaxID=1262450 RepID=S3CVI6_OPHP1|nr:hypothetical protein F503_06324 [Ophiostoma piceae UAMH 11346]